MEYKSGFVAIMGSPNVGKSTLMNALLGMKIAIVTEKAQTTRNKVVGILTRDNYQMVFLDTPGVHTPKTRLGEYMVKTAYDAQRDVDVTLVVLDAREGARDRDRALLQRVGTNRTLVAVNKIDVVSPVRVQEVRAVAAQEGIPDACILEISAKNGEGLARLEQKLLEYMLPGPQFYPPDMVTDRPERFIAAELIREKALIHLRDEIPHGVGVEIEKVEEGECITNVAAVIYCERDSHKGIIIGKRGAMLRQIGSDARADLQMLFGSKVFLELWVKVKKDWRNSGHMLKELGYRE